MYLDSQGRDEDRHRAQNDFTLYPSQGCFEIMNLMPFYSLNIAVLPPSTTMSWQVTKLPASLDK